MAHRFPSRPPCWCSSPGCWAWAMACAASSCDNGFARVPSPSELCPIGRLSYDIALSRRPCEEKHTVCELRRGLSGDLFGVPAKIHDAAGCRRVVRIKAPTIPATEVPERDNGALVRRFFG